MPTAESCGAPATPARQRGLQREPSATTWRPRTRRPGRSMRPATEAADRAGAEAQEAGRLDGLAQAALADIRSRELAAADAARAAAAHRDRLADEGSRCESACEAAERDLAAEAARGIELEREAVRLEAWPRSGARPPRRPTNATPALDIRRRELAEAAARLAAEEAGPARAGRPVPARRRPPAGSGRAGPDRVRRIGADSGHRSRARAARPGDRRDARAGIRRRGAPPHPGAGRRRGDRAAVG